MIRIGLIQFPGSNCERETALAVQRAGMEAVEFLWNESLQKLENLDGYILIGGFSYEDRSRAGIIAALDPVLKHIKIQAEKGKPVLGICNGAQILLESGLIPGYGTIALAENKRIQNGKIAGTGFYNAWVHMRLADHYQHNAFTSFLNPRSIIHLPVAHAEGRFIMPEQVLQDLQAKGLALFQYCDQEGEIVDSFPVNPNGSMANIAAISNEAGNVLAMMPHPERTVNGDALFTSMREYISSGCARQNRSPVHPEEAKHTKLACPVFQKSATSVEYLVKLNITDNQALTVQKTLRKMGFPITVSRYTHWEVSCEDPNELQAVLDSGVLYCERKEQVLTPKSLKSSGSTFSCLVSSCENMAGQQAEQTLISHYKIHPSLHIKHSILWQFHSDAEPVHKLIDTILSTHIIGNRYAHQHFSYDDCLS